MNIGLELRRQVINMRTLVYVEGNNNDLTNVLNIIKEKWPHHPNEFRYSLSTDIYGCKELISTFHTIFNEAIINPTIVTNEVVLLQEISLDNTSENTTELFIVNGEYNFYNIKKYYPNIRPANNIMKMYLSGTFDDFLGD